MSSTTKIFLLNGIRLSSNRVVSSYTVPCQQCLHNEVGANRNGATRDSQYFMKSSYKNLSYSRVFLGGKWSNHNKLLQINKSLYDQNSKGLLCIDRPQNIKSIGNKKLLQRKIDSIVHQRDLSLTPKAILDASPPSFQPYLRLVRFDKPIGTWLLYWPCTWSIGLAAAPGHLPDFYLLALFGAGAFFMRSVGCIINDMWDKDYDKMFPIVGMLWLLVTNIHFIQVERTKLRPLASGELSYFQGLCCLGGMLPVSLMILLQLNWYSVFLGAASMLLVITYPLAKRVTYWPQAMLGVTLNWGVLVSWSAIEGSLQWPVIPLYVACVLYTMIYDTIYSHQDKYDDMLIGVKSTALKFGDKTKQWLSGFGAIMISGLTYTGMACDQTWPYFTGVAITAAHITHQLYTVDLNNADDCGAKFRSNKGLGLVMFLSIVIGTLMREESSKQKEKDIVD